MSVRGKVADERIGGLCEHCKYHSTVQFGAMQRHFCSAFGGEMQGPLELRATATRCSQYSDKRQESLFDLKFKAWYIRLDAKGRYHDCVSINAISDSEKSKLANEVK